MMRTDSSSVSEARVDGVLVGEVWVGDSDGRRNIVRRCRGGDRRERPGEVGEQAGDGKKEGRVGARKMGSASEGSVRQLRVGVVPLCCSYSRSTRMRRRRRRKEKI